MFELGKKVQVQRVGVLSPTPNEYIKFTRIVNLTMHKFTFQAEFLQLMQDNRKQLEDIMQERQLDRFDHFGNFIAAHLKTKPAEIADFYIKEITNLVLSDINIEISMRTANQ